LGFYNQYQPKFCSLPKPIPLFPFPRPSLYFLSPLKSLIYSLHLAIPLFQYCAKFYPIILNPGTCLLPLLHFHRRNPQSLHLSTIDPFVSLNHFVISSTKSFFTLSLVSPAGLPFPAFHKQPCAHSRVPPCLTEMEILSFSAPYSIWTSLSHTSPFFSTISREFLVRSCIICISPQILPVTCSFAGRFPSGNPSPMYQDN